MSQPNQQNQASQEEIQERINQIQEYLLYKIPTRKIEEHCAKEWGVTTRQIRTYIQRARKKWLEKAAEYEEEAYAEHLATARELMRQGFKNQDPRLVLDVLRYEEALLGLRFGIPQAIELLQKSGYKVIEDS